MHTLSWKIAIFTGILVTVVVLALTTPLYWFTRNALEDQLAEQLQRNARLLAIQSDLEQIDLLQRYPAAAAWKDSLTAVYDERRALYSAESIYWLNEKGEIILLAGSSDQALLSTMIHQRQIRASLEGLTVTTPLFSDDAGNQYKSVFQAVQLPSGDTVILGMDASAAFLQETIRLRNRLITIGISVLIISITLAILLSNYLTVPLNRLIRFAREIGKGEKNSFSLQNRRDEIGFLGQTMQEMQSTLKRREKETKQLIASVAHEIRNPLAGMRVQAELLSEALPDDRQLRKHATSVLNEIAHLNNIVENFLAFARPIEGQLSCASLADLMQNAKLDVMRDFPDHQIEISGDGSARVHPGKIRQTFYNLLKNACENSPAEMPIRVSIRENSDCLQITFHNFGKSIPAEIQSQIFDAFFTTKAQGVGLGLSITRFILDQHGGTIELHSSDKNGTVFVICFPQKE